MNNSTKRANGDLEDLMALPSNAPAADIDKNRPSGPAEVSGRGLDGFLTDADEPSNEIFVPVHEYVWLTDKELVILGHPSLLRLRSVYQLGFAHLVFPGATHSRFEHSLGSVQVAQMIANALKRNRKRAIKKSPGTVDLLPADLSSREIALIRLSALLHDIGHIPAGHSLEDELELLPRHDEMKRLDLLLGKDEWFGIRTENLRELINGTYKTIFSGSVTPAELVCAVIAKNPGLKGDISGVRLSVCRDIVGNTICADFLDYIHRDYYHLGKPIHLDTRIFQYMELAKDDNEDAFVISLGTTQRPRTDAITAIASLLDYRYQLCEIVLFHRTKCKATAMLDRALHELQDFKCQAQTPKARADKLIAWQNDIQEKLFEESDTSLLKYLLNEARECEAAMLPLKRLLLRRMYRDIATFSYREIPETRLKILKKYYSVRAGSAKRRLEIVRELEADYDLPKGSVVIYCPATRMNAKIPQVKILLDEEVDEYQKWEDEYHKILDGGHMDAQLQRFERMWRVQVALDGEIYDSWSEGLRAAFYDSVKCLVIQMETNPYVRLEDSIQEIAKRLTFLEGSPYYKKTLSPGKPISGRRTGSAYRKQVPTLRSFFSEAI